jgi:hypothetical protein
MSAPTVNGSSVTLTADRLTIHGLTITDPEVVRAIHDWGTSHPRGPEVALAELPEHVKSLISLGARVSTMARGSTTAEAVTTAARTASDSVALAAQTFTDSVSRHLDALLSGDSSAVADALRDTLTAETKAMTENMTRRIDAAVSASVSTGLDGAVTRLHDGISAIGSAVTDVRDKLTADTAASAARAAVVDKAAIIKGANFEDGVCAVLDRLAGECSAEFTHTGRIPGVSGHGSGDSLKGDGVWHTGGHTLVIETHDSLTRSSHADGHKDGWSRYLSAAMKNRSAGAALGIVRSSEQNKGQLLRDFGSTMAVVVCDPDVPEDIMRLKFVVQVMVLAARYHDTRGNTPGVYGPDLGIARRAVADLAEKAAALADIERLALKTAKAATELHDRVTGLKVGMATPLDRARETLEAMVSGGEESS